MNRHQELTIKKVLCQKAQTLTVSTSNIRHGGHS